MVVLVKKFNTFLNMKVSFFMTCVKRRGFSFYLLIRLFWLMVATATYSFSVWTGVSSGVWGLENIHIPVSFSYSTFQLMHNTLGILSVLMFYILFLLTCLLYAGIWYGNIFSYCKVVLILRECFISPFFCKLELFCVAIDANIVFKNNLIAIKKNNVPTIMFFFLPLV